MPRRPRRAWLSQKIPDSLSPRPISYSAASCYRNASARSSLWCCRVIPRNRSPGGWISAPARSRFTAATSTGSSESEVRRGCSRVFCALSPELGGMADSPRVYLRGYAQAEADSSYWPQQRSEPIRWGGKNDEVLVRRPAAILPAPDQGDGPRRCRHE